MDEVWRAASLMTRLDSGGVIYFLGLCGAEFPPRGEARYILYCL